MPGDGLDAFERLLIRDAVARAGGEVSSRVRALGIPHRTFCYRIKRLGFDAMRDAVAARPAPRR